MGCNPSDPLNCVGTIIGDVLGNSVPEAWLMVSKSFVDAASQLLLWFGKAFASIPPADVTSPGVRTVYEISLSIAAVVMALLLLAQVIRTAITHDGTGLAQSLAGLGKAALAFLVTITVASAALLAADELTGWIVQRSFGSMQALSLRLAYVVAWKTADGSSAGSAPLQVSALLVFALIGILLVIVLWFELLLRNAAIAILVATSPIAAAGLVADATRSWWTRLASATMQLIILKPVIALVFAVGFGLAGQSTGVDGLLEGLLVLLLAVVAWPVIARFFTFANVTTAGGSGLGAVLGFAAGRASAGGGPSGINPAEFSVRSEARTMAGRGDLAAPAVSGQSTPAAANGPAPGGGTGTAGGTGGAVVAGVGFALQKAQQAANALAGQMERTAGHAGMPGANPYAQPAGYRRSVPPAGGYRQPPGQPAEDAAPQADAPPAGQRTTVPDADDSPDIARPEPAQPPDTGLRDSLHEDGGQP
jgi:hypothetical protein